MSIVAGGTTLISFALLGLWPKGAPIKPLEKMYPLIWAAFVLNAITGVALFCADATTRAANWDFWIKLGAGVRRRDRARGDAQEGVRQPALDNGPVPGDARTLAMASLVCWFGAICAGRLIAYVGPVAGL